MYPLRGPKKNIRVDLVSDVRLCLPAKVCVGAEWADVYSSGNLHSATAYLMLFTPWYARTSSSSLFIAGPISTAGGDR